MTAVLNDDVIAVIKELKSKNYQRPQIKTYLQKNKIVDNIGLSTISKALANKKIKNLST